MLQPGDQPRLTDDAIAFLQSFFETRRGSNPRVLEFGSGGSTVWLSKRTRNLVSVEHDPEWATLVRRAALPHVDLRVLPLPYHGVCAEFPDDWFDLVIVDGLDTDEGRMRLACAKHSMRILKPGGVLMFDNVQIPEFAPVCDLLAGWPMTGSVQRVAKNAYRAGNETNWWIKPASLSGGLYM